MFVYNQSPSNLFITSQITSNAIRNLTLTHIKKTFNVEDFIKVNFPTAIVKAVCQPNILIHNNIQQLPKTMYMNGIPFEMFDNGLGNYSSIYYRNEDLDLNLSRYDISSSLVLFNEKASPYYNPFSYYTAYSLYLLGQRLDSNTRAEISKIIDTINTKSSKPFILLEFLNHRLPSVKFKSKLSTKLLLGNCVASLSNNFNTLTCVLNNSFIYKITYQSIYYYPFIPSSYFEVNFKRFLAFSRELIIVDLDAPSSKDSVLSLKINDIFNEIDKYVDTYNLVPDLHNNITLQDFLGFNDTEYSAYLSDPSMETLKQLLGNTP